MDITLMYNLTCLVVLLPLVGCLIAGLFGHKIGPSGAHWVTCSAMGLALVCSLMIAYGVIGLQLGYEQTAYYWGQIKDDIFFEIGFLVDSLTAIMLVVVTFVSFLVHVYSIGYMHDDPGYQRFFSYISLFTFAMLMLVSANNFLQLFFGWEGVGLASYLLIGFWFNRESANQGSLKAFLVNRVGDFGFALGIAAILAYFGSLNYGVVFDQAPDFVNPLRTIHLLPGVDWSVLTLICLLLFIGAMGKSAQVPLHVWLPESMEGPTPISALIHAATMVTAGIFMVARMSPLFELSDTARSVVLVVGATGALMTGLIGIVQNDIKRVVAYSTLSQLGYMTAALGVSAYAASIFHLVTHAAFKALLFLAAGSVIIALHHEQDMRKMGGLYRHMPITYFTFLIGSISLCALPPFAGYFSKDAIIAAVQMSHLSGSSYAYICVLIGTFVTALYTFRALFLTFHGKARYHEDPAHPVHESPMVVWLPLVCLAVPSIFAGMCLLEPLLIDSHGWLSSALLVLPEHDVLQHLREEFHGLVSLSLHAMSSAPFWLASLGILTAWLAYLKFPALPGLISQRLPYLYHILVNKFGFDRFNDRVFVHGSRELGEALYQTGDLKMIDDHCVNGSGRLVQRLAKRLRTLQTGYLYHYALVMVVGLFLLLAYVFWQVTTWYI